MIPWYPSHPVAHSFSKWRCEWQVIYKMVMLCYLAQAIRTRMFPYIHIFQFFPLELSLGLECPESSFCSNDLSFPSGSLFWHVTIFLPPLLDSSLSLRPKFSVSIKTFIGLLRLSRSPLSNCLLGYFSLEIQV